MKPSLLLFLSFSVAISALPGTARAPIDENLGRPTAVAFPIKIAIGGRYLTDDNGVPFLLWCDTAWNLFTSVPLSRPVSATTYFMDRSRRGFNAVYCPLFSGISATATAKKNFSTYDGIEPFHGYTSGNGSTTGDGASNNYDITKPNAAYFERIVDMVNLAAKYNMAVILNIYETAGWEYDFSKAGTDKVQALGAYIAKQFSSCPNIIYNYGDDYQDWQTNSASESALAALIAGVESVHPRRLHLGCEMNYNNSTTFDDSHLTGLDGNCVYTYFPMYVECYHAYSQSTKPIWLVECNYEAENYGTPTYVDDGGPSPSGTFSTRGSSVIRHQIYWGLTSGLAGFNFGNWWTADNMSTSTNWNQYLSTSATSSGCYLVNLLRSRNWWKLVPDTGHTFCTAGYGTQYPYPGVVVGETKPYASGSILADHYCTAALATDGSFGVVYVPQTAKITIDLSKLAGPLITAHWMDPVSGALTAISGSPFSNSGTHDFTSPGVNSDGVSGDWVLLLDVPASGISEAD